MILDKFRHFSAVLDAINDTSTLPYLNYIKHPLTKCLRGNSVFYNCENNLSIEQISSAIVFDVMWDSSDDIHQEPTVSEI